MKREWKPVKDYEGLYEVSNYGEVKSLERFDSLGRKVKEKILKFNKNKWDYLYVDLYKNGVKKHPRINRLVYSTFVGDIPDGLEVNHIDENKENNRVDNLNLMTSKQNNNWGDHISKVAASRNKPVEALKDGRVIYQFASAKEAAQKQKIFSSNITNCCRGKAKSYKGFIWQYKENAQV